MSEKNISSPPSTPPLRPSAVSYTSPQRGHTKYYPECPEFKIIIRQIRIEYEERRT